MVFRKKTVIVIVLIISFLGSSFPYKAQAGDLGAAWAKLTWDRIAKAAAWGAFKALANRILQKVQTGSYGDKPTFVQNWRNFQLESQYRSEAIWRGLLYVAANGDNNNPPLLCDHIRESDAIKSLKPVKVPNLIESFGPNRRVYSLQETLVSLECDPELNSKIPVYKNDFVQGGGWDTFVRLLSAQNRTEGAVGILIDDLEKQRLFDERAGDKEALSGGGFTALRAACKLFGLGDVCLIFGDIKTPGSILKDAVASIFDTSLKFYTTADAASLAIAAISEFAVGKFIDNLASSDTSDSGFTINNDDTYKNEFCTAKDDLSQEAFDYIKNNYSAALANFPASPGGSSYCERFRNDDNIFPFERCINACSKAVGLFPNEIAVPRFTETPPLQPNPPGPEPASLLSDIQAERANYGTPMTPQELSNLLNAVARKNQNTGWGLLSKPSGTNCPFILGPISCDILFHKPSGLIYDVLIASETQATPAWNLVGPENDLSRWFPPAKP